MIAAMLAELGLQIGEALGNRKEIIQALGERRCRSRGHEGPLSLGNKVKAAMTSFRTEGRHMIMNRVTSRDR